MTVTEAARELGLTTAAVRIRLERGQMQGRLVHPRLWLIPRGEVERAKLAGRQKPGPKPRPNQSSR